MDRYSTFVRRIGAGFIDALVFLPIGMADRYLAAPERGAAVILLWGTVSYSAYWLYSVFLHARYGQTLGKMVTRVTVLDVSEERIPTLRQAFLRDAGYIILNCASLAYLFTLVLSGRYSLSAEMGGRPAQILAFAGGAWFLLEIGTMATNRKRRALHDYIARTVAVRDVEPGSADHQSTPTVLRSGLSLVCPRCTSRYPSRYCFADPNLPDSICNSCSKQEHGDGAS